MSDHGYGAACARALQSKIKEGPCTVSTTRWGETVIQYADRYSIGSGLVWCTNPGQWRGDERVFSGVEPDWQPEDGDVVRSEDGRRQAYGLNGAWFVFGGGPLSASPAVE